MTNEDLDLIVKRIMKAYVIADQQDIPAAVNRNKGYISQIKSRKHIPKDFINLLKLKYPKAFENEQENIVNENQPPYETNAHRIPVYEHGPGTKPDFWWKGIPRLNDCDHAIRAKGVSMAALIKEGSIVIGKELYHKEKIVMGEIYIIKTVEQEYIRYVNQHPEKEDYFILTPYNQKAGVTVLNKGDVINLYEYRACFQFA